MKYLGLSIEWKLKQLGSWSDQVSILTVDEVLTHWSVPGMNQPSNETLEAWCLEFEAVGLPETNFNPSLFAGTLSVMFSIDEVVELRSSFGILQGYAEFHTHDAFVKMKQYLDKLELAGDLTANQKARIYTACQNQGINLNNY